jgi:predicted MFS family arabinose efflux permease
MADNDEAAALPSGITQGGGETHSRGYRAWLLIVLMLVNMLNLADRQGLAAIAPALKLDLKLTDTELGLIQGLGFAIFYTLLGLPLARLAERHSRARIIAASVAVFSAFLLLCSQARSFGQILLFRIGVGAGDAGFGPPVASLIGDHYPARQRASAMTVIWLGAPIGAMAGAMLGGWVAQHADWRWWFIGLSIPSLLIAAVAFFTLREPRRGQFDEIAQAGPPPSMWEALKFLLRKRSMVHVLIGAGLAATGMNGIGQFWGRYFVSVFEMSMAEAGQLLGIISVVAMASGLALGGFGVERLAKRGRRWFVWGPAIALVLTTPLFLLGITRPTVSTAMGLLLAGHIALFVYYTPTLALAQNMVGASMRASSAFVLSLVLGLVGIGLGPTLVGILSDILAHHAFAAGDFNALCPGGAALAGSSAALAKACSAASAAGITQAIGAASLLFAWGGVHYALASRHLERDLDDHYQVPPTG